MAWIQQVNQSLGGEFEANLHSKGHAQSNQQQVLAQTVLFRLRTVFPDHFELFGDVYLLQRHSDLHEGDEDDDQALADALLGGDEGSTLGPPVALEFGVHASIDPVQQAVYVISRHIPLLVLEKIRTRWNKRRDTDFVAKHELRDFSVADGVVVVEK